MCSWQGDAASWLIDWLIVFKINKIIYFVVFKAFLNAYDLSKSMYIYIMF